MATPNLLQLSKELSYKLQDPVSDGTVNGVRLTADERLRYINAAYRRLVNLTTTTFPEMTSRIFNNFDDVLQTSTDSSGVVSTFPYLEVHEVTAKWLEGPSMAVRAYFMNPNEYLGTLSGMNEFYTPDLNRQLLYWTILDGKVKLLPENTFTEVFIRYKKDIEDFVYDTTEIVLSKIYWEILLSLGASVAYTDTGEINLSRQNYADALSQLQVFNTRKQEEEIKDES